MIHMMGKYLHWYGACSISIIIIIIIIIIINSVIVIAIVIISIMVLISIYVVVIIIIIIIITTTRQGPVKNDSYPFRPFCSFLLPSDVLSTSHARIGKHVSDVVG